MPTQVLPTLSGSVLDELKRKNASLQLPPETMLGAPETILQFGFGKFLRGYVVDFVQSANQDGRYLGRVLVVQRDADHRSEAFARQGGLYTLILRGNEDNRPKEVKRVIGSVSRLLVAESEWTKVVEAVERPALRVIVSNATETGLSLDNNDRADAAPPRSFPGKLTQLLYRRWQKTDGVGADIAVIPTELVLNNGALIRQLIFDQASAWKLEPAFLDWAGKSVHIASTLVDRIVVGTPREEVLAAECHNLGYRDDLLTAGEPFYLLAMEADDFIRKHFPLNLASPNVRFVEDLAPFRRRKLRLLNGPQMVLSTLGTLLDLRIVREAVEDPQLGAFNEQTVWKEIIPAMGTGDEAVNVEYARESLERIGNPTIEHRLQGIRVDLTAKNYIRLIPSIRDFMDLRGELPGRLLLTMAAMLEVVVRGGLQDAHAGYVLEQWKAADANSSDSLLKFTRDSLAYLAKATNEELDVAKIAPEVRDLLAETRNQGLRKVLSRRYSL